VRVWSQHIGPNLRGHLENGSGIDKDNLTLSQFEQRQ
jgi:hypothetical protein